MFSIMAQNRRHIYVNSILHCVLHYWDAIFSHSLRTQKLLSIVIVLLEIYRIILGFLGCETFRNIHRIILIISHFSSRVCFTFSAHISEERERVWNYLEKEICGKIRRLTGFRKVPLCQLRRRYIPRIWNIAEDLHYKNRNFSENRVWKLWTQIFLYTHTLVT